MGIAITSSISAAAEPLVSPKGLFWFARKNCWSSKIGYHLGRSGERTRSQQYYSSNYNAQGLRWAEKRFRAMQVMWDQIVNKTDRANVERQQHFKGAPLERPIWPVTKLTIADPEVAEVLVETTTTMKVIGAVSKLADPTIDEVRVIYLQQQLGRTKLVGRAKLKFGSYNNILKNVEYGLKPHAKGPQGKTPIDASLKLSQITLTVLRDFYNYWHSAELPLSDRTRKNYCRGLWQMLIALDDDETVNFNMPKGSAKLFRFGGDRANIREYDAEILRKTKEMAMEKTWLFCLCAINSGMYQCDISSLMFGEIVRFKDGKLVSLTREQIKKYDGSFDIYSNRIRDRTAHKYPYPSLHWLFPELGMLMAKYVAKDDESNPNRRVLLGRDGQQLQIQKIGKSPSDAITKGYEATKGWLKKAGMKPFTMKQFRKLGSSFLGATDGGDTAVRLYRSQPPLGDASMYQLDDYQKKLTPHLREWREKLLADGVL